jgi:type VI secretion system protein ImpB
MASIHKKLEQVRKPRVHITYDVETNGAQVQRELPFVIGVMGDFSGHPSEPQKPLKDRKFVQIDRDNFDEVMAKFAPALVLTDVKNTLAGDDSSLKVELRFRSMADFEPARIAQQVPALRKLLETRAHLTDLMAKADRSEGLEELLEKVLKNSANLKQASVELGLAEQSGPQG